MNNNNNAPVFDVKFRGKDRMALLAEFINRMQKDMENLRVSMKSVRKMREAYQYMNIMNVTKHGNTQIESLFNTVVNSFTEDELSDLGYSN